MVKGIKEIYAERVIFYNHYIQGRIWADPEIYLLNVIYRYCVLLSLKKIRSITREISGDITTFTQTADRWTES